MKPKATPKVNRAIAAKARQVLQFAETRAKTAGDWLELHFALFGVGGKATELFTTVAERTAFSRTPEYKRLLIILDRLPRPTNVQTEELLSSANGAISVRLPRSVHAALLAEAQGGRRQPEPAVPVETAPPAAHRGLMTLETKRRSSFA